MKRALVSKTVADFTAADLYRHWSQLYDVQYGRSFQGFPARDLKLLKQLQEGGWSNAEILMAMAFAMVRNLDGGLTVPVFVNDIEKNLLYKDPLATWQWITRYDAPAGVRELIAAWEMIQSIAPEFRDHALQSAIAERINEQLGGHA